MAPMENLAPGYHYPMDHQQHHQNQFQPPQWNHHQPPPPHQHHYQQQHQWNNHHPDAAPHHTQAPPGYNVQQQMNYSEQQPGGLALGGSPVDTSKAAAHQTPTGHLHHHPGVVKQPLGQTRVNVQQPALGMPGPTTSSATTTTAGGGAPVLSSHNNNFDNVLKSPTTRVFESMLTAADSIATPAPKRATTKTNSARKNGKKKAAKKPKISSPKAAALPAVPSSSELMNTFSEEPPLPLNSDGTENPFAMLQRDAVLYKKVVLCMALQRQPKENKDEGETPKPVISEGFYWKDYPPCETVLYESMPRYYELSKQSRQSKEQQAFNNELMRSIRITAEQYGYTFDPVYFTDKRLRDRIRCFFKTHLQNGKKRLMTMQKHPESLENQQALLNLIAQARSRMANDEVQEEQEQLIQDVVQETHDACLLPPPVMMDDTLAFTFSDEHDSLLPPADADDYEIDGKKRRRSSLSSA